MTRKNDWMKRSLMGSTTLPYGAFPIAAPHVHKADGSCCGHDHSHDHGHDHGGHDHGHHHHHDCGHDHAHDEDCTNPKGECC